MKGLAKIDNSNGPGELLPLNGLDGMPIPGITAQKMQTRYATAVSVQKPRILDKIVTSVERESEYAGENFFYAWGEGKNHIEGPSVGLALCVAREWGNCAVESDVEETPDAYIFTGHFIDLETGFTLSRSFRQSKKWTVYGKMDEMRKSDIRFQIGQSKAIRNVIRAAMPNWLLEKAIEVAKESVRKGITKDGIAASTDKAFNALARLGVSEERVLAYLNKESRNQLTTEDIISLRTAYTSINNGEAYAKDIFPSTSQSTSESPSSATNHSENTKPQDKEKSKQSEPVIVEPKKPTVDIDELLKDAPIGREEVEKFFRDQGKLQKGQKVEDNPILTVLIVKNLNSLVDQIVGGGS